MSDAFETLGVEAQFELDGKLLEERHRMLSKTLHPDRYVGRPAAERRMALDRAIAVNVASRELRDPVKRAEILLARLGVQTGELAEPKASPMLLMEMMEVREELSEAHRAKDLDRIGGVADRMRGKERAVLDRLREGFAKVDDTSSARELVPIIGELRYVKRFFEELEAIEEQLME
jgi:molecular chaperone HscB